MFHLAARTEFDRSSQMRGVQEGGGSSSLALGRTRSGEGQRSKMLPIAPSLRPGVEVAREAGKEVRATLSRPSATS
jgi:hypothetical protein